MMRSIVGTLLFIAGCGRPDISYLVNLCAQYALNPSKEVIDAAFRILDYLANTRDQGLEYV